MAELPKAPGRIAVVQPAGLDEVVSLGPLVGVLKLAWPAAKLTLAVRHDVAAIAACIPGVDKVVPFDLVRDDKGYAGLKRVAKALGELDLVLAAEPTLRAALLAWLTSAPARVGNESTVKGRFFTVKVPLREREPVAERAMDLARALGVEGPMDLLLKPPPDGIARAKAKLGQAGGIGLVVGGECRAGRWPAEYFAALADRLDEGGRRAVLLGGLEDKELAAAVAASARRAKPLELLGDAVSTLCAATLLQGVVGGDTGLTHVARAAGTPTLMLFGPTDPGGHTLEAHVQALRLGLDCQPCAARAEQDCPLAHHGCMRNLEVERVGAALTDLLARGARR